MCTVLNNNALMGDSIFVVPFRTKKHDDDAATADDDNERRRELANGKKKNDINTRQIKFTFIFFATVTLDLA